MQEILWFLEYSQPHSKNVYNVDESGLSGSQGALDIFFKKGRD